MWSLGKGMKNRINKVGLVACFAELGVLIVLYFDNMDKYGFPYLDHTFEQQQTKQNRFFYLSIC